MPVLLSYRYAPAPYANIMYSICYHHLSLTTVWHPLLPIMDIYGTIVSNSIPHSLSTTH